MLQKGRLVGGTEVRETESLLFNVHLVRPAVFAEVCTSEAGRDGLSRLQLTIPNLLGGHLNHSLWWKKGRSGLSPGGLSDDILNLEHEVRRLDGNEWRRWIIKYLFPQA